MPSIFVCYELLDYSEEYNSSMIADTFSLVGFFTREQFMRPFVKFFIRPPSIQGIGVDFKTKRNEKYLFLHFATSWQLFHCTLQLVSTNNATNSKVGLDWATLSYDASIPDATHKSMNCPGMILP